MNGNDSAGVAPEPFAPPPERQRGFLGAVERIGNMLPDPTMIFVYLILVLMVVSAIGAAMGWSASLPYPGETAPEFATLENGVLTYTASSLFSEANVARLFAEMPRTFAGFAPLGLVLTIMMGAAVAERAKAAGVENVVFDRGGYVYHGRVKALLDATREAGLNKSEAAAKGTKEETSNEE